MQHPAMKLLPVLDLWQGQVVRGIAGQRDAYRPLISRLTTSADVMDVAIALQREYGVREFYLADLDGIRSGRPNWDRYQGLIDAGFDLWLDLGLFDANCLRQSGEDQTPDYSAAAWKRRVHWIVGLESIASPAALADLLQQLPSDQVCFSLDLKAGQPLTDSDAWPGEPLEIATAVLATGIRQLIVLDLAGVGLGQGVPTIDLCRAIRHRWPELTLITGGGVRDTADLTELESIGIDRALVASALHDGRFNRQTLSRWLMND